MHTWYINYECLGGMTNLINRLCLVVKLLLTYYNEFLANYAQYSCIKRQHWTTKLNIIQNIHTNGSEDPLKNTYTVPEVTFVIYKNLDVNTLPI